MSVALFLAAAVSQPTVDDVRSLASDIDRARVYAADKYRCDGWSDPEARKKVAHLWRGRFERRWARIWSGLSDRYGPAWRGSDIMVVPGRTLTPEYCGDAVRLVPKAFAALDRLEQIAGVEH